MRIWEVRGRGGTRAEECRMQRLICGCPWWVEIYWKRNTGTFCADGNTVYHIRGVGYMKKIYIYIFILIQPHQVVHLTSVYFAVYKFCLKMKKICKQILNSS